MFKLINSDTDKLIGEFTNLKKAEKMQEWLANCFEKETYILKGAKNENN